MLWIYRYNFTATDSTCGVVLVLMIWCATCSNARLNPALILESIPGCAAAPHLPQPDCLSAGAGFNPPTTSVWAARAEWTCVRMEDEPLTWTSSSTRALRHEPHHGTVATCVLFSEESGSGWESFHRHDCDTITLHQSAWFAMVILQANAELAAGLFWEIPSFEISSHGDTWISDFFSWFSWFTLEHRGGCLTKGWGEMAQWSCGWQVSEFKPPPALLNVSMVAC